MARHAVFPCLVLWIACCSTSLAEQQSSAAAQQFQKRLYDQIGDAWYRSMQQNSKNIPLGTAHVTFIVLPNRTIVSLRVLSNTSNQVFAKICLSAIQQVKVPPIPTDVRKQGKIEEDIWFKMFPN